MCEGHGGTMNGRTTVVVVNNVKVSSDGTLEEKSSI